MKKTAILFLSLSTAVAVNAQGLPQVDPVLEPTEVVKHIKRSAQTESSVNVVWSEDFANGIPADWSQNGTPATAQWEYRGPNTTPSNATGGRGNFSGINNNPPTNTPILSTTASNGFMIFDSDYLDNGGTGNFGSGTAAAPHVGRLTTDTIDLSMHPSLELKFEMYARRFFSDWFVAFSTDGGATFTDTIEFFDSDAIAVNGATADNEVALANVSSIIGGQSQVVMQFIFDGTPGNANGNGYYFWMLDDIELRTPPANQMLFTGWQGAPPHDMIYNSNGAEYPKYGIMHTNQIVPVEFDANFYNYGTQTQTNATLDVEIWDVTSGTPSLLSTISAPGCPTLASGDTCNFNDLTTPTWTPPAQEASYLIVYKAVSDSITSAMTTSTDTFSFFVNDDLYSTDRNQVDNFVGTNSANPEIIAMGVMYDMSNEDPNGSGGVVYIDGININLSALTDSTADIEVAFYDTTGFAFNAGFPAGATAAYRKSFTLNGSLIGTVANFSLQDANGNPLVMPNQPWLMIINFFPNATDGVIRIANDASFDQPDISTVMQLADGNWFGGFTSDAHEGTHIRLDVGAPIGIEETEFGDFSMYPNPTAGATKLEFADGGTYAINVTDMTGSTVISIEESVNANEAIELDMSSYPMGIYLVNIKGENASKTVKLTVK
ncbi:MAG: T9SS type A sorting domain-containing protein [Bacteroidetes bacterium]|nr:T9SS type A sorting domain-containing protein [Bacteroidota bacterium]